MLGTELGTALAMLGSDYKTARSASARVIADVPGLAALLSRVLLLAPRLRLQPLMSCCRLRPPLLPLPHEVAVAATAAASATAAVLAAAAAAAAPITADSRAELFASLGIVPRPVDYAALLQSDIDTDATAELELEELLSTGAAIISPNNPLCNIPAGLDRYFDDELDIANPVLEHDVEAGDAAAVISLDSVLGDTATMTMTSRWARPCRLSINLNASLRLPDMPPEAARVGVGAASASAASANAGDSSSAGDKRLREGVAVRLLVSDTNEILSRAAAVTLLTGNSGKSWQRRPERTTWWRTR
jgi:hypothetical protein